MKNLLLILLVGLSSLLLLSCQNEDEDLNDFGPQSTMDEINEALTTGINLADPGSINVGDFIHRLNDQSFSTSNGKQSALIQESGYNVVSKVETSEEIKFTLVREVIDYTQDEVQKNTFESELVISLVAPESATSEKVDTLLEQNKTRVIRQYEKSIYPGAFNKSGWQVKAFNATVTYHNLSTAQKTIDVPARVLDRENCGGVPTCKINVFVVVYDEVVRASEKSAERFRNEYYFSNEIPYSPYNGELNILQNCFTGIGRVENSRLLLKQCSSVIDFRFGSETNSSSLPESVL